MSNSKETKSLEPLHDGEFDDLVPVLVDIPWGGEGEYVEPTPFDIVGYLNNKSDK